MKRGNNKLLNKVLAVAITACLVFMSVPATAVADLAVGSAEGAAQNAASKDEAATSDDGASDASAQKEAQAQGEASAAQPADASDGASKDAASSDSNAKAAAGSAETAQSSTSETLLPADLTKLDLVEVDPVSRDELTAMLASAPAAAPPSLLADAGEAAPDYPEELDGTKVEQISVEWITPDTVEDGNDSRLSLAPSNDDPFDVRMRLNLALSGEHDYEAGDIQVTIPKSIFETRDGKMTGKLSLSVPEAPDSRATFNYTDMGVSCCSMAAIIAPSYLQTPCSGGFFISRVWKPPGTMAQDSTQSRLFPWAIAENAPNRVVFFSPYGPFMEKSAFVCR